MAFEGVFRSSTESSLDVMLCFGGAHCDRRGILHQPSILGTSNPGAVSIDLGGVARNVAENLVSLGCRVALCSRVGRDEVGSKILSRPLDTSLVSVSDRFPTASYTAILEPTGELVIGLADMSVYDEVTPSVLAPHLNILQSAVCWFLDTNFPSETIAWLLLRAGQIPVAVDSVSVAKAPRIRLLLPQIDYLFCNLAQASSLAARPFSDPDRAVEELRGLGSRSGVVSAGANGIAVYTPQILAVVPALPAKPRDVTGAGDALVAGTLYGLLQQMDLLAAAKLGLAAAAIAVESAQSASADLTPSALLARTERY